MENESNIARFLLDATCARMNIGLSAVATALALAVFVMATVRASEITAALSANPTLSPAAISVSQPNIWTYY